MARPRIFVRNMIGYLPLDGCIIFFHTTEAQVRSVVSRFGGILEAHKINGEFLNKSTPDKTCDMYVCLKGALEND